MMVRYSPFLSTYHLYSDDIYLWQAFFKSAIHPPLLHVCSNADQYCTLNI